MATIAQLDVVLGLKGQGSFRRDLLAATAAVTAAGVAFDQLITRGGRVAPVMRAFGRAANDQGSALTKLRSATMGLVSDYDLMAQANTALALGSAKSTDEFAKMASVAQRLGRALGLDATFALNSLNTGIARQSRLILDNLGIIVDASEANRKYAAALGLTVQQLNDAQKAEAFRQEALRQAEESANRLGDATFNAADGWEALKTEMKNTADILASEVAGSDNMASFFERLASALRSARGEGGGLRNVINQLGLAFAGVPKAATDSAQFAPKGPGGPSVIDGLGVTVDGPIRRPPPPLPGITGPRSGFDTLTGRRTGLTAPDFLGRQPFGFDVPGVSAIGPSDRQARNHAGLLGAQALEETIRKTERWKAAIVDVSQTVENVLVRSLTRAIMKFEGINNLLKDIGKSLLASLVGGAVSFGIGKITDNILGGLILGFGGGRATGGPVQAGMAYMVGEAGPELFVPNQGGTVIPNGGVTINVPPARDPITTARDAQWKRAILETFRSLESDGFRAAT